MTGFKKTCLLHLSRSVKVMGMNNTEKEFIGPPPLSLLDCVTIMHATSLWCGLPHSYQLLSYLWMNWTPFSVPETGGCI